MNQPADPAASIDGDVFLDRLAQLRGRFIDRTRQDATTIRLLRERWQGGEPLAGELLELLKRMTHGLAGAAGVFGFDAVSDAAHRLEGVLRVPDPASSDPSPLFDDLEAELSAIGSRNVAA